MTEAEWLASTEPYRMLDPLEGKISDRKCVLISVACLRRVWHLLVDERSLRLVEVTERWTDGLAGDKEADDVAATWWGAYEDDEIRDGAGNNTLEALRNLVCYSGAASAYSVAIAAAEAVGCVAYEAVSDGAQEAKTLAWRIAEKAECRAQAALVRDILGPLPFRPVIIDPSWLTWNDAAVGKIAQRIYEDRDFRLMPVLADALEDAGCDSEDILRHCREPGEHVRGCWVLDRLLGKE